MTLFDRMRSATHVSVLAAVALAGTLVLAGKLALASPALAQRATDKSITVPTADAEMNAAIAKARAALPSFWTAFAKPRPGEEAFALKVKITGNGETEHFWLNRIERKGEQIAGTINNEPSLVKSVKNGQRYIFAEADVTDWMFMRNGKIVGNETMRPLLKRMPEAEARRYRSLLESP